MNRRALLTTIGAVSFTGFAGCTDVLSGDEDTSVELLNVEVINLSTVDETIEIKIDHDGETAVEDAFTLADGESPADERGRRLDCTWPTEPGEVVVASRREGESQWEERNLSDADADCAGVIIIYEEEDQPPIMPSTRDCDLDSPC